MRAAILLALLSLAPAPARAGAGVQGSPIDVNCVGGCEASGATIAQLTKDATGQFVMTVDSGLYRAFKQQMFYANRIGQSVPTTGTDNPLFLFVNPVGSGKDVIFYANNLTVQDSAGTCWFKFFFDPVVTSSGTSVPRRSTILGSGPSSSMEFYHTPTISDNGTSIDVQEIGPDTTVQRVGTSHFIIKPGHTILITGRPSVINMNISFHLRWSEH